MANDLVQTHNAKTDEITVRELTDDEQAIRDAEKAAWLVEKEQKKLEEAQLRQIKIVAYEKLGLTEAEIEALLPTPVIDELDV